MNIKVWTLSSGKGPSGTFPSKNCKELMEQVTGLEMPKEMHSFTSKIHFRTESWFRAHMWPRAGEVRTPRDRFTS